MLRPPKESALRFAERMAPLYAEMFHELKADGGRVPMQNRISLIRHNVGRYVTLYDDERRLGIALLKGLISEQGFNEFEQEAAQFSEEETEQFLAELAEPHALDELTETIEIPSTEQGWKEAEEAFKVLPPAEQAELIRQGDSLMGWAIRSTI